MAWVLEVRPRKRSSAFPLDVTTQVNSMLLENSAALRAMVRWHQRRHAKEVWWLVGRRESLIYPWIVLSLGSLPIDTFAAYGLGLSRNEESPPVAWKRRQLIVYRSRNFSGRPDCNAPGAIACIIRNVRHPHHFPTCSVRGSAKDWYVVGGASLARWRLVGGASNSRVV